MKRMVLIIIFTLFVSPALAEDYIKLVFDFQHPGGDYIHFQESSARECARKCEKSSRCQAFDFHTSDNSCWLKDQVSQLQEYQGAVTGAKSSRHFKKSDVPQVDIQLNFDTQRPGGDYSFFHAQDERQCAEKCVHDPRCVAFDFTTSDSLCYLKSWGPPAREYKGIISGVKRPGSPIKQPYFNQVKTVQGQLLGKGYNPGTVDGLMGRKTQFALENYQRDSGLPVTGRIDEATLRALRSGQVSSSDRTAE
jgi:hypothetical protein